MRYLFPAPLLLAGLLLAGCATHEQKADISTYNPQFLLDRETVEVPLINDHGYQWRVRAEVNGTEGEFILDSGTPVTVVTPQFARKAQLADAAEIEGPTNQIKPGRFASITLMRLGNASYGFFYAPLMNLDHLSSALKTEIDGIIGGNVLNRTAYRIDWQANLLTLYSHAPAAPGDAIRANVRDNRVYLPAAINGQPAEFVLDTGAYCTTIARDEVDRLRIPREKRKKIQAPQIDLYSERHMEQTQVVLDSLSLGPLQLTDHPVLTWDYNALGVDLLSKFVLTVDARDGWISLAPR